MGPVGPLISLFVLTAVLAASGPAHQNVAQAAVSDYRNIGVAIGDAWHIIDDIHFVLRAQ
jgi:hypothetical protein